MRQFVLLAVLSLLAQGHLLLAQESTLSYEEQWALLESELDSLAIFNAIDSLLMAESELPSEFNFRLAYNSNILSAGRNYDLDQQSVSPGIAYYDKTGLWADISGYWNNNTDPNYSLTILSGGYLDQFSSNWSYGVTYERWLLNGDAITFENTLGVSSTYQLGPISFSGDYSFLFGNGTANRIIGTLSGNLRFKKWWIFDRVRINPSANIILGNGVVTTFSPSTNETANNLLLLSQLTEEDLTETLAILVRSERITGTEARRIRNGLLGLTDEQYEALLEAAFIEENEDVFGLLNYSFSLPVSFYAKRFFVLLAYTYSIPVQLPGETIEFDPIGYFSVAFNYRLFTK